MNPTLVLSVAAAGCLGIGAIYLIACRKKVSMVACGMLGLSLALFVGALCLNRNLWQIVPGLITAAGLMIMVLAGFVRRPDKPRKRGGRVVVIAGGIVGSAAAVITMVCLYLLPPIVLPQPAGTHAVGVIEYDFIDSTRSERFGPAPGGPRELMVRIWYPAQAISGVQKSGYAFPGVATEYGKVFAKALAAPPIKMPLPGFLFNHAEGMRSHSYAGAPFVAGEKILPVLLFSHGIGIGQVTQNTVTCEELASHGYVVVSIAHPFECGIVRYTDGRLAPVDINRFSALYGQVFKVQEETRILKTTADQRVKDTMFMRINKAMDLWAESIAVWTADTRFVLDRIFELQQGVIPGPLAGRLDTARIGAFGHSFGGATSARLCLEDGRVKAGINYDCHQFGFSLQDTLRVPFMFIYAQDNPRVNDPVVRRCTAPVVSVSVKGSKHFNFGDIGLCGPFFRVLTFTGAIDGHRCLSITTGLTRAFFDKWLLGREKAFSEGVLREYPEIEYRYGVD